MLHIKTKFDREFGVRIFNINDLFNVTNFEFQALIMTWIFLILNMELPSQQTFLVLKLRHFSSLFKNLKKVLQSTL